MSFQNLPGKDEIFIKVLKFELLQEFFHKLLTYILCNNTWSENFLFYHKACFWRKT